MVEGWKKDKFKNQIQNKSGYTWSKEQELKTKAINSVRVLTVSNIQTELDLSEELYLQNVSDKDKNEKIVNKDWCIAVSSNGNRKRIGNAVFIKNDTDYLFASFLTALKPKDSSDILPEYFFRWLTSYNVQERISSVSEGTTGLGNLDMRYLRNIDINYPESITEQASIANILSKVDEAIESVKKSIAAAEKLKKSLMQNLLTGRMKPDGTLRTEEEFYEDEKFGKVPIGWEVKKVKNCFKFKNGKGNTTSNLKEIPDDEYCVPVYGGNGITGYYHSALLNKPTIIIGRVGEYCGNVFKTPEKSWVTDNAMLVSEVLMQDYNIDFFTIKLNSLNFKQYSDSTGQPKITQGSIGGIFITYPVKIEEQNKIIYLIDNISNNIQQKQTQIITLERLKKSLMQNLLTGKVRVGEELCLHNQIRPII